jgi:glucosamine kinase
MPIKTDAGNLGLGIDAGGTLTRWALSWRDGTVLADGHVAGLSALQMGSVGGRQHISDTFATLAEAVLAHGKPCGVLAGITGFDGDGVTLASALAALFDLAAPAVVLCNDIEIAYRASFEPGQGYLIYAGTGSIGAWIDTDGRLHRAGGRGVTLDDGGGGFWIAREAMRHIWRDEDECPGRWQASPMARAVFDHVGGSDWQFSRQFMYAQERGAIGRLALAVAASADSDPVAAAILDKAGVELARLAQALASRFGARPVVLSGRAAELHPRILRAMAAALPPGTSLTQVASTPHIAAARIAANQQPHSGTS